MNEYLLEQSDFIPFVADERKSPWGRISKDQIARLDLMRQLTKDLQTNNACMGAAGMLNNVYLLFGDEDCEELVRDGEKKWVDILDDEQHRNIKANGVICLGWCIATKDEKNHITIHWIISYVKQHGVFKRIINEVTKHFESGLIFPDELKNANEIVQKAWDGVRKIFDLDYSHIEGFQDDDDYDYDDDDEEMSQK